MPNVDELESISVARVQAEGGPTGAKQAFEDLESRMASLRGRKMYGVFYAGGSEEIYYACVKLDDEHPDDMGLERATIPGGQVRSTQEGWLVR